MSRIKNFFAGKVDFRVADLPVACLNKLRQYKIYNIANHDGVISFSVPLVNANAVKKLVTNFDWQMHENFNLFRGINFLLNRFVLTVSVMLGVIAFWLLDMGIYDIRVVNADAALTSEIYAHLRSVGVKKFMPKNKVADLDLAEYLVAEFPTVAHANVRVMGNTLLITLAEATYHTAKVKTNIYAQYDAVIKEVIAYSGHALVQPGDVVRKGDLLVENAYEGSVAIIGEVAYVVDNAIIRLDISII